MKIKTPVEFQTFNDGVCSLYAVGNIAKPGNKPKDGLRIRFPAVPYEERTVGVTRYYMAKQAGIKAEAVIRIPQCREVSSQNVCCIGDIQYRIQQVQQVLDTLPPATDLTLQRLEAVYDIARVP